MAQERGTRASELLVRRSAFVVLLMGQRTWLVSVMSDFEFVLGYKPRQDLTENK